MNAYITRQARRIGVAGDRIARHGKAKPIKKARVAARRLAEALTLIEPLIGKKPIAPLMRDAKKVRKALGEARDLDVMLSAIALSRVPARMRESIERSLTKHRKRALKKARRTLSKHAPRLANKLMADLKRAASAIKPHLREALHAGLDALAEAIVAARTDAGLHPVRIAAKRLRYTLEIGVEVGLPIPPRAVERLKRLQDDLGAWHDATLLAAFLSKSATRHHRVEAHTADAATRLRVAATMTARALRAGKQFGERWRISGPLLERAVRRSVPAHAPAT